MMIYGVTGMPLSGKTTVAEMMENKGYTVLDMGDVVRIEMEKRNMDTSETSDFVNSLREKRGRDAIAMLSIPYLEEILEEREKIVITGMRGLEEKKRFEKETGEEIEIIAVWASRQTRKKRREKRQREEDLEGQEFHERDIREIENGMGKLMALSDQLIKNDNISMDKLEERVDKIVN